MKQLVRQLLSALPDDGRAVRRLYRRAQHMRRQLMVQWRSEESRWRLPPPDAVIWVDPARIRRHTNRHENGVPENRLRRVFPRDWSRRVEAGDWDLGGLEFEEFEAYKAIRARILTGTPWSATGYWRESLQYIADGKPLWGCRDAGELARRFEYVDSLIESIRRHGMVPHAQLGPAHDPTGRFTDDIEVNIGRNGEFLFQDGRHRLAIAKVLGLREIPVKVKVRHQQWQEFREYMFTMVAGGGGASRDGVLYQSPLHPDLREIPAQHSCEDRFRILHPHLRATSGRLLDIGCNLGFFCNAFEQAGLECIGIEYETDIAYAASRIALAEGCRYQVINGDVLDARIHDRILQRPVDVVLALNIFHHFMKTKADHDRLIVLLRKLQPRQLFFEPHRPDELPMQDAYANPNPEEFVAFVQRHAGLTHSEHIGMAPDGRKIFSLYR